jgi:hypothetical protein
VNLYLIKRKADRFIEDTFAYAIVAAETGKAARHIHPTKGVTWGKTIWGKTTWVKGGRDYGFDIWTDPSNVRSRLIGVAIEGTLTGMVCTSFN